MESKTAIQTKAVQAILRGAQAVIDPCPPQLEKRRSIRTYYMNTEGRVSQRRWALPGPSFMTCRASTTAQAVVMFKARFPEAAEGIHAAR